MRGMVEVGVGYEYGVEVRLLVLQVGSVECLMVVQPLELGHQAKRKVVFQPKPSARLQPVHKVVIQKRERLPEVKENARLARFDKELVAADFVYTSK